ncbi:hypothetical protein Y032_0600g494 [Ancylostoma ceylanicum]|uniref:Glutathione synthetase n=2 Tax=Ancylostoma ceylanicum TaxID=53326 RepID=A0A016WNX3_9BILA|nr:hypothetical protein Y032_0600g494 [Ancylostoma ceylanicum]
MDRDAVVFNQYRVCLMVHNRTAYLQSVNASMPTFLNRIYVFFELKIEVNNIASSMGAHAERVTKMHRRTMTELGYDKETIEKAIPKNEPIKLIAEALYKAWELYSSSSAVILIVVEDQNQNQIDQKHVEYALEDLGVPVDQIVRRTLTQCEQCLTLSPERHLFLSGSRVAVVYFRAGYTPDNYPTEKEWAARLLIERSDAIKSPWIGLQVANTKKTQQVLAEDGVVERFVGHPRDAAAIRSTFAGLWAINGDDPVTQKLIKVTIGLGNNPFPPLLMLSETEQLLGFPPMKSHIVWDDPICDSRLQLLSGTLKIAQENNQNKWLGTASGLQRLYE